MEVASKTVVVPEELHSLKTVYELCSSYETIGEIQQHLGRAADQLAESICRDICESEQVRSLLKSNPDLTSYWDVAHIWYQELINSLIAQFPDQAVRINAWAKNERFGALIRVKW